jgi:bifunctional UDP-N-acetylglucosamine pyrophosphorylase/glucosamine-1-phosphate N-acetyltransferase
MIENNFASLSPLACVILAAGQGTRMQSAIPKVMHSVAGLPMIKHVLTVCTSLPSDRIVVVVGAQMPTVIEAAAPHPCVVQQTPRGTGDAVKAAAHALTDFQGEILVLFGDVPLITVDALRGLQSKGRATGAAIVVAGFRPEYPGPYGRLVLDADGHLIRIIEASEATTDQGTIGLCNGGAMLFAAGKLWPLIDQLRDDNAKEEFYLTDCIKLAHQSGDLCAVAELPVEQMLGINTRIELAQAEKHMQRRLREKAMLGGVTMIDPDTVYLSADTKIGRDVILGPHVVLGLGVDISDKVEIQAFCHLEQTKVGESVRLGPFARLRPKSTVGPGAHIGNFVEIKNAEVGAGAKIGHLSYIGDADIGAGANIGAGTITCNYDGFRKYKTEIGAETFIGSNSSLVAPVKIGAGAYVGAGSVITMDVPAHTLAVARSRQANIEDWARRFRDNHPERKDERQ